MASPEQNIPSASTDNESLKSSEAESSSSENECKGGKRYNLRLCSQVNRVQVERRKEEPKKRKPKSRPPPLSKYRRKTANSRERSRMNEINDAFEQLKDVIPDYPSGKMTKITTLRLAMNYMAALREMLGYSNESYRSSSLSSPEPSSSSDGGSTGSVSDCSSPEPCCNSNSAGIDNESASKNLLAEDMDIDTDESLKQLFELKLDSSLSAPLDTALDDVFPQASSTCVNPPADLFVT